MPDGPIIGAEEALTSLRDAGHGNSPDKQFARRALAGSFCELFDPNLPVADFDGNVQYGGMVTVPAATVDADIDKGFLIFTPELREAVEKRDERTRDVQRNAMAEMAPKNQKGSFDKLVAEAKEQSAESRYGPASGNPRAADPALVRGSGSPVAGVGGEETVRRVTKVPVSLREELEGDADRANDKARGPGENVPHRSGTAETHTAKATAKPVKVKAKDDDDDEKPSAFSPGGTHSGAATTTGNSPAKK